MPDELQPTGTVHGRDAGSHSSSSPSIEEGRFPAGTTLAGRYRILGLLGRGGMGEVYRAVDLILNQPVALKFLSQAAHTGEAALARFRNEVRIARQVSHPNVCRVYDIGVIEGLHFLSMEYVDGEDLASLLRRIGRLAPDKALEFTRRICAGLAAAHERGVLHRDLKPANIMIDGRGQVRITDFGLAALAAEVQIGDIRSGTPAYMSPEQKAGKEVTTRSDLYSLGMVLHEMFTGKRPGEGQSSQASLVKDLDPTIERVILRCLDQDPRNRPSSALSVAMALPGGDPIAAALAAGETPSPEMVAASGEKEGLQPRTAIACFTGVVLLLVALVLISSKTTLLGRAPLPLPPDALVFKAREMLKQFGYTEEPVSSAYGFFPSPAFTSYQRYLRAYDFDHRWERLASHQPVLISFLYFQHQDYLRPISFLSEQNILINGLVTPRDPPVTSQGMVRIILDPKGRLEHLEALPSLALSQAPPARVVDLSSLLAAGGLDAVRFTPSQPEAFLPVYADSRMAWTGSYEEGRPDKIRVEAAALNGRPVYYSILGPWQEPEITATPPEQHIFNIGAEGLIVAVLIAAALVAWRNVRMGRGDKKGAWRIAALIFAAGVASWALVASHVPTLWELYLLLNGLSLAAFQGGFVGLLYLAVEPYVRKNWPDALISWVRIVGGRVHDPLAASHVLAGVCAGLAFAVLTAATALVTRNLTSQPTIVVSLNGARFLLGQLLGGLNTAAIGSAGVILVLVLLRSVVRLTWVADGLFVVLMASFDFFFLRASLTFSSPAFIPVEVLRFAANIWILRRFGLLALVALVSTMLLALWSPCAVASWYAALSLTTPLIFTAVAAWSLYTILAARPSRPASESTL